MKQNMKWLSVLLLSVIMAKPVWSAPADLQLQRVASNLGVVWGMAFLDAERLLFTVRSGKAGVLEIESGRVSWLSGLPELHVAGQGGLLDVAVPPSTEPAKWIYFIYSQSELLQAHTVLARARLQGSELVQWQTLLVSDSDGFRNIHFGSRIAFDGQGHLFFSIGDRGERENAQNTQNHAGSILRLNLDGSLPKDNPFIDDPQVKDEIWSYGHRNPQGLVYDLKHDRLWAIEHGPRGGDEINLVIKGKNYGWPVVSQGKEYFSNADVGVKHHPDMQEPVYVFTPSIAPSDLLVYQGAEFPQWQGSLLSGALKLRHLNQVTLDDHLQPKQEQRYLQRLNQRIRSLEADRHGRIYIGTDQGNIYRLTNP